MSETIPSVKTTVAAVQHAHEQKMTAIRTEGQRKLQEARTVHANRMAVWDLQQAHQREEAMLKQQLDDAVALEHQRNGRAFAKHLGLSLRPEQYEDLARDVLETERFQAADARVRRLRVWLLDVARTHGLDLREDRLPQLFQGTAVRTLKRVSVPTIQSFVTAAIAAHEIGHVVGTVNPDAPSKPGEFGLGRICVADEIAAWRWAVLHAPVWNQEMHAALTRGLTSYRVHATEAEARQIDAFASPVGYRLTWLERAEKGLA